MIEDNIKKGITKKIDNLQKLREVIAPFWGWRGLSSLQYMG
jgi:hypothetical protein